MTTQTVNKNLKNQNFTNKKLKIKKKNQNVTKPTKIAWEYNPTQNVTEHKISNYD